MNLDFTVIISNPQNFNGTSIEFNFNCPLIDKNQPAILFIQGFGVETQKSVFINNIRLFDYINPSVDSSVIGSNSVIVTGHSDTNGNVTASGFLGLYNTLIDRWVGNTLIVPINILKIHNVMKIESIGNDNFKIDNVFLLFKTVKDTSIPPPPDLPIG